MDLIEAIHQGNKEAIRRLAATPDALKSADVQGNTPLHYAVAQRDLELIEYLIQQGAPITAKNLLGETAADWFQEYIASTYTPNPAELEKLKRQIEINNIHFVADCLKSGISRRLRFARGETLLHIAVESQKKTIVELLLEGISNKAIKQLLQLKNSRGMTPLVLSQQGYEGNWAPPGVDGEALERSLLGMARSRGISRLELAQEFCRPGRACGPPWRYDYLQAKQRAVVAQEIIDYLQSKQRAAMAGVIASAIQIQTPCLPLTFVA